MPSNPIFKASYAEWRTVMDSLRHYADYLAAAAPNIEDEDEHLIVYDDMERLDRIIPSFERQFNAYMEQIAVSLDQPVAPSPAPEAGNVGERANA